jgi:hypothetical protein
MVGIFYIHYKYVFPRRKSLNDENPRSNYCNRDADKTDAKRLRFLWHPAHAENAYCEEHL